MKIIAQLSFPWNKMMMLPITTLKLNKRSKTTWSLMRGQREANRIIKLINQKRRLLLQMRRVKMEVHEDL